MGFCYRADKTVMAHGSQFSAPMREDFYSAWEASSSDRFWAATGKLAAAPLNLVCHPEYKLRGQQLGYRPKTNAYDAWTVEIWDQYIRELAIFGNNAIELMPPRSDDLPDSPHFPLPPAQMMVEMSRIADSYGLDVWIWYPAMAHDYSDPATVASEVKAWGEVFAMLPRVDAVFVPGGDPGHTEPKYLLALLEKQKKNLLQFIRMGRCGSRRKVSAKTGCRSLWTSCDRRIPSNGSTELCSAPNPGFGFGDAPGGTAKLCHPLLPRHYAQHFQSISGTGLGCRLCVDGRPRMINPRPQGEADILRGTRRNRSASSPIPKAAMTMSTSLLERAGVGFASVGYRCAARFRTFLYRGRKPRVSRKG